MSQEVTTELKQINYREYLKVSDTRLDQIQISTLQDSMLQYLKKAQCWLDGQMTRMKYLHA